MTIVLKKDQDVYFRGDVIYKAKKGESLDVIKIQPCRSDASKDCYKVKHAEHGKGIVRKEWVE